MLKECIIQAMNAKDRLPNVARYLHAKQEALRQRQEQKNQVARDLIGLFLPILPPVELESSRPSVNAVFQSEASLTHIDLTYYNPATASLLIKTSSEMGSQRIFVRKTDGSWPPIKDSLRISSSLDFSRFALTRNGLRTRVAHSMDPETVRQEAVKVLASIQGEISSSK